MPGAHSWLVALAGQPETGARPASRPGSPTCWPCLPGAGRGSHLPLVPQGKEKVLSILSKHMEVHGTVFYESQRPPEVPAFVKNHGLLPQPEFQQLLRKAKVSRPPPRGSQSGQAGQALAHACAHVLLGEGCLCAVSNPDSLAWQPRRFSHPSGACGSQPGRAPGRSPCGVRVCGGNGHGPARAAEVASDAF